MPTVNTGIERLGVSDVAAFMPTGRQAYCGVRNVLETNIDERSAYNVANAEQALAQVVADADSLQPPLPKGTLAVIEHAVKQSAQDRGEDTQIATHASEQSAQVVWALMQVVYEHGYEARPRPRAFRPGL